jgi:hypothetical protein
MPLAAAAAAVAAKFYATVQASKTGSGYCINWSGKPTSFIVPGRGWPGSSKQGRVLLEFWRQLVDHSRDYWIQWPRKRPRRIEIW